MNNSFSVERAASYFTVTGVSKQVLFSLIIYYLTRLNVFFHGLCDSFLLYHCHRLVNKLPVILLLLCYTFVSP